MSTAFFYHDLAGTRQGAMSGLRELQQSSCQGLYAALVHVKSFLVRPVDEDISISGKGQKRANFLQGSNNV